MAFAALNIRRRQSSKQSAAWASAHPADSLPLGLARVLAECQRGLRGQQRGQRQQAGQRGPAGGGQGRRAEVATQAGAAAPAPLQLVLLTAGHPGLAPCAPVLDSAPAGHGGLLGKAHDSHPSAAARDGRPLGSSAGDGSGDLHPVI